MGVVVSKSVYDDNYQFAHKRQRKEQQFCVVVRDVEAPDVVMVYLESQSQASSVLLGAVVTLRDFLFSVASSNKFVYLKALMGASQVGVLGVLPSDQLRPISTYFPTEEEPRNTRQLTSIEVRCRPSAGIKARDGLPTVQDTFNIFTSPLSALGRRLGGLLSIPSISLRSLVNSRLSNRCVWRVLGNIVVIKSLGIYLRCSHCLAPCVSTIDRGYATASGLSGSQYACIRCNSHTTLRPLWQAQLVFDDGTTECLVHAEDYVVLQFLRSLPPSVTSLPSTQFASKEIVDPWLSATLRPPAPLPLSDVVSTLETACYRFGKVEFNDFAQYAYRKKYFYRPATATTETTSSSASGNGHNNEESLKPVLLPTPLVTGRSSTAPSDLVIAEETLVSFLNSRSVNVPVQVVGKLVFQKISSYVSGSSSSMRPGENVSATEMINVRLQVDNTNAPWQTKFVSVTTQAPVRLSMDAIFLQALHRPEDITLQTELLLSQLT